MYICIIPKVYMISKTLWYTVLNKYYITYTLQALNPKPFLAYTT